MIKRTFLCALASFLMLPLLATGERSVTSEVSVDLMLDNLEYVSGERVRAVVDVANLSPYKISYGYSNSEDLFYIEVFRSGGNAQLHRIGNGRFVARFSVNSNEGQKLETFLGDHYSLRRPGKYLARPVLVHRGMRYEGRLRAFSIVPGSKCATALQMFKNREGLHREFELRTWSRKNIEHLFLLARDTGVSRREWVTTDLGPMMKITAPVISILPSGEVIVVQRYDRDHYLRSEFWSLPDVLEFQKHELVMDPETAGSERIKELYHDSGGVQPKSVPWWKFW